MPCYLRISGDFEPSELIAGVDLPLEIRHRKGEVGRGGVVHEESLVQIAISHAEFAALDEQFEEMANYVFRRKELLREFCRGHGIASCTFDFGGEFDSAHAVVCRTIPQNAILAAAVCNASIELSLYAERLTATK